jgi:outer membrane protein assembly factor BamB
MLSSNVVIDGKFIQGVGYATRGDRAMGLEFPRSNLEAYDQVTGELVWSTPIDFDLRTPFTQGGYINRIDDERMLIGNQFFSIEDGTRLPYDNPRSLGGRGIYDQEIKIGFSNGPSTKYGINSIVAYDFSDPNGPGTPIWTSEPIGMSVGCYGDGKLFVYNTYNQRMGALDAMTGQLLWMRDQRGFVDGAAGNGLSYHDGKVFSASLSKYLWANDADTGEEVWFYEPGSGGYAVGQPPPVGYGKVYWLSRDGWISALDENTGELVWKYASMNPFGNSTNPQIVQHSSQLVIGDNKVYRIALQRATFMGGPHPHTYGGQGQTRFVCLNAHTGELIWDAKNWFEAWGPRISDGKLYGADFIYDRGLITEDYKIATGIGAWTYCIGKGPTEITLSLDKAQVKTGETVKISGQLVDISPGAVGNVPAGYTEESPASAPQVPINITYAKKDGVQRPIVYIKTDKDGKFSVEWAPWVSGEIIVHAEAFETDSYEAPAKAELSLMVKQTDSSEPILWGGVITAIIVAVALPILVFVTRKSK